MREVIEAIERWLAEGKRAALATVLRTWGSAPRPAGSKMAVSEAGEMVGSVSAGCVEGAVLEHALEVLRSGRPEKLRFGVSDDTAWEVGLACGGEIEIFVEPLATVERSTGEGPSPFEVLCRSVLAERPVVRAVVTDGPGDLLGSSIVVGLDGEVVGEVEPGWAEVLRDRARVVLASGVCQVDRVRVREEEAEVFFDVLSGPPLLVIIGGVHIAVELTRLAKMLGYRVVIVDPRRAFATPERFPEADALVTSWPDEALRQVGLTPTSAVAALSHDPKLDDPALMVALRSPAFYVGALGSRRTQALRRQRLLQAGLSQEELSRLHGPLGLDIGGQSPGEIALSILAEIVSVRSARARGQTTVADEREPG